MDEKQEIYNHLKILLNIQLAFCMTASSYWIHDDDIGHCFKIKMRDRYPYYICRDAKRRTSQKLTIWI